MNDHPLLARYPKSRPELPEAMAAIYADHYRSNREGGTPGSALSRKMERWLHRQVAADVVNKGEPRSTLEIGAGTLNQLPYEPAVGPYDIVEPFTELYTGSPELGRVRRIYADIGEVPEALRYDRITAVATFEHLCDLPAVVAKAGLLLTDGGVLRAAIPSEGTLLWTLGWRCTTALDFWWKYRMNYADLMRHEHVNTAWEVEVVLRYFFAEVRRRVFGVCRALSFYQFFECRGVVRTRCTQVLTSRGVGPRSPETTTT